MKQLLLGVGDLAAIVEDVEKDLRRRLRLYREGQPLPGLRGRPLILVDDGIATGWTIRAALRRLAQEEPGRIVLAMPVAAPEAVKELRPLVDQVVCLHSPRNFNSVGEHYRNFQAV